MKRHFLIALPVCLLLPANGLSQNFEADGLYYNIIGTGKVEVAKEPDNAHDLYNGVICIPESVTHDGTAYDVVRIGDSAFSNSGATDVQIPNSVIEIGDNAFQYAQKLTSITLPSGITEIPKAAFEGTSISAIAVPEGVTVVGEGAFQTCSNLETVFLPSTSQTIEAYGFNNCQMLHEIYCPAITPPEATGWAIFIDLKNIDLIVPEKSTDIYGNTAPWSDTETFNIYTPETFEISLPSYEVDGDFVKIPLGGNFAYKIYEGGTDGHLLAVTAADYYYIRRPEEKTVYTIVPTNYFYDAKAITYTIGSDGSVGNIIDGNINITAKDGNIMVSGGNEVTVYAVDGRVLCNQKTGGGLISGLPAGNMYIVRCGRTVKKVVL